MFAWARACIFALLLGIAPTCSSAENVNYAEVRTRVSNAFREKEHEMAETLVVLQDLSKATSTLLADIREQCNEQA